MASHRELVYLIVFIHHHHHHHLHDRHYHHYNHHHSHDRHSLLYQVQRTLIATELITFSSIETANHHQYIYRAKSTDPIYSRSNKFQQFPYHGCCNTRAPTHTTTTEKHPYHQSLYTRVAIRFNKFYIIALVILQH